MSEQLNGQSVTYTFHKVSNKIFNRFNKMSATVILYRVRSENVQCIIRIPLEKCEPSNFDFITLLQSKINNLKLICRHICLILFLFLFCSA